MENDRTLAIVAGYHECNYPPQKAYDAGLTERFAVVFDTYRREREGMYFDAPLFMGILTAICQAIPHDSLTIDMGGGHDFHSLDEFSGWCLKRTEEDSEPPKGIRLFQGDRTVVAHAEVEEWVSVGGPAPYHDSYTLSFYMRENRADEFRSICERVSKEMGATVTGFHEAQQSKEPYTPLWKAPLKWLGMKAW